VWDIVAETGLFRLKGHRDEVTGLVFCDTQGATPRLVTCSKDSHLRVWDLTTQHCVQTVVGHRCEVWSLDVDAAGQRLVTGAADAHLRVFRLSQPGSSDGESNAPGDAPCLVPCGAPLVRPGPDRAAAVRFSPDGTMLAVMSAGRLLELWNVHSEEEARRRAKRRRKRKRDKAAAGTADVEPPAPEGDLEVVASDEMTLRCTVPLKHKALALAWCPKPPTGVAASFAVTLATNSVEVYDLPAEAPDGHTPDVPAEPQRVADVSLPGHRADVRAVALSSDDSMLVSTSHAGAKVRGAARWGRNVDGAFYPRWRRWAPCPAQGATGCKRMGATKTRGSVSPPPQTAACADYPGHAAVPGGDIPFLSPGETDTHLF
jgi:U3 small nucleolar RNA-associated protein 12